MDHLECEPVSLRDDAIEAADRAITARWEDLAWRDRLAVVVDAVLATVADHADTSRGSARSWNDALEWLAAECREGTP